MELLQELEMKFGYNNPILLKEIERATETNVRIRKTMSRLVSNGQVERFSQGVYYIPKITLIGKSRLSTKSVYEKKYIKDENEIYGYYTGLFFQNAIGLTTQVPNTIEIVTNREKSRLREIKIGNQKIRLKRSRAQITKENANVLQLLDLITEFDLVDFIGDRQTVLSNYIIKECIPRDNMFEYIPYFPAKTAKKLIESGLLSAFI